MNGSGSETMSQTRFPHLNRPSSGMTDRSDFGHRP